MPFRVGDLAAGSLEDAVAYWLFAEDEAWERWQLVPGSQTLSPDGRTLRLAFELEGERFELALIQREEDLFVKFDDREDPERELPARVFAGLDEVLVMFAHHSEQVFLHLELAI